ncbi:hypothetical protein B0H13DRAFT_1899572 [Mycena leptocephala]|nr:hypothetical protein B0H13DRAFT_1899572 [Mycena leptocephala]
MGWLPTCSCDTRARKRNNGGNNMKLGSHATNQESAQRLIGRHMLPRSAPKVVAQATSKSIPSAVRARAGIQNFDSLGIATEWEHQQILIFLGLHHTIAYYGALHSTTYSKITSIWLTRAIGPKPEGDEPVESHFHIGSAGPGGHRDVLWSNLSRSRNFMSNYPLKHNSEARSICKYYLDLNLDDFLRELRVEAPLQPPVEVVVPHQKVDANRSYIGKISAREEHSSVAELGNLSKTVREAVEIRGKRQRGHKKA